MAFDELGRYVADHKAYDQVGNIVPDVESSEGNRPHLSDSAYPASWLPVQFFDKHFANWFVVMPGKAVALDPDSRLMPAEYGLTGASVVYTQSDVDAGTIDIATGEAVTTAKTVTLARLTGVRHSTWTKANAGTGSVTSGFMGKFGVAFGDSVQKYAIGFAPYAYIQWAGGDGSNPTGYKQNNYNMQHRVAVLCDYVLRLPLVPAQEANENLDVSFTGSALVAGAQNLYNRTNAQASADGRYNATTGTVPVLSTYPVIAIALNEQDVAKQTSRTLFSLSSTNAADDLSGLLVEERTALSAVTQAGDYFVDYPKGVIFVYSADGNTVPTQLSGAAGTPRITYYRNGANPSTVSKFGCVLAGGLQPGDFVKVGANSNLVVANPATDNFADILGQVLSLESHPRDALDRVRTAYNPALSSDASGAMSNGSVSSGSVNAGQLDQMPGSANGGVPASIHYSGAADTIAVINLISR